MNEILNMIPVENEQLVQIIIYGIAIFFIILVMRSLFRIFLPIILLGLVMVVFLGFSPDDVINQGKQFIEKGKDIILENEIPFLDKKNGDGNKQEDQIPGNEPSRKNDLIKELDKSDGSHNVL